ncbi:MAG TPA: Rne/Rng family ribonuclease [Firmicutes bacterium]|nr:Rne/Rng family ribonuclease [Bacillota bacterium]
MGKNKKIVVNCKNKGTRVAVLEDNTLVEIYMERPVNQRVVGNIYCGIVENVLPGMQSAFIDIGQEKNAFLYIDDARVNKAATEKQAIEELLRKGDRILVQVVKEPFGSKGARLTRQITLPGRYLVLMPTMDFVGISRRIEDAGERERLKELVEEVKPASMGVIVRTVAEGVELESFRQDMDFLLKLWSRINSKMKKGAAPILLYQDLDLIYRIVRDLFTEDVVKFIVDSPLEHEKIMETLDYISADLKKKVFLYEEKEPIFDYYGIEEEIKKALARKIWLKRGGYLVLDQVEALTVIDVNTGKYTGKNNVAETILETNLEAVEEIVRQLRLRDIGGIIIIDFIDMNSSEHRHLVLNRLEEKLKEDRTRTHILGLTSLGMVEMTRKKVRQGIDNFLQQPCPYCGGKGKILSAEVVSSKIEKEIRRILDGEKAEAILVEVNQSVASLLIGCNGLHLKRMEEDLGKHIFIRGSDTLHIEKFNILKTGTFAEIEKCAFPVERGKFYRVRIEEPHANNPYDGIARVEGYVIDVLEGGAYVGELVDIEITETARTCARAVISKR